MHERDKGIELDKRWDVKAKDGDMKIRCSGDGDALAGMVAEWVKRMRKVNETFDAGLPERAPDYSSGLQRNDLLAFEACVHARVQNPAPLVIPSLRSQAMNDVAVALRIRPKKHEQAVQSTTSTTGDALAEQE
jgi:hypothetical protein